MSDDYRLLDSGGLRKFEQFGHYQLVRPAAQAVWLPELDQEVWDEADASFDRSQDEGWTPLLKKKWEISIEDIRFKLMATDFGHIGIFPEQKAWWKWIRGKVEKKTRLLNLFAYSGGATIAAAQGGAQVCHLDASKGMVGWARENAALNGLEEAPIRWIVDDVRKFLMREIRRGSRYDAIVLDPPTFGRGTKGEVFKIEYDLPILLEDCRQLLSEHPLFILLSCHTPGYTPLTLHHLLWQNFRHLKGHISCGEMLLEGEKQVLPLPSGTYAKWDHEK